MFIYEENYIANLAIVKLPPLLASCFLAIYNYVCAKYIVLSSIALCASYFNLSVDMYIFYYDHDVHAGLCSHVLLWLPFTVFIPTIADDTVTVSQCYTGQFDCGLNSTNLQCINVSLVCNGNEDCMNGADEAMCGKYYNSVIACWLIHVSQVTDLYSYSYRRRKMILFRGARFQCG